MFSMTDIFQMILKRNMCRKVLNGSAKQYLIRKNRKGLMDEIFEKIGKYYYDDPAEKKNGEFDIVTQDDRGIFSMKQNSEKILSQRVLFKMKFSR